MHLSESDMVLYHENGKIMGGGFTVESMLLRHQLGGKMLEDLPDDLKNMTVPAGLAVNSTTFGDGNVQTGGGVDDDGGIGSIVGGERPTMLSDDIYDRLLNMINLNHVAKSRKTRKQKSDIEPIVTVTAAKIRTKSANRKYSPKRGVQKSKRAAIRTRKLSR